MQGRRELALLMSLSDTLGVGCQLKRLAEPSLVK